MEKINRRTAIKTGLGALAGLSVGELIRLDPLMPGEAFAKAGDVVRNRPRRRIDYSKAKYVTSVCLNCSTVCGLIGTVIDGKLVKVAGNPNDPNNGFSLCAKGQASVLVSEYPERLLYPLKRAGKRGEGLWQRITWEEAHAEIARRIRSAMDQGVPEEVAIHIGRSRLGEEFGRFLGAIGSPTQLNHRALCSSAKRAANYISLGETDWETIDAERCKYFLNFGSNFYEAHQGAIHLARRVVKARAELGAKLVTFDVRLSNTAGRSDEWFAPTPGSEGAIALAMANVLLAENLQDSKFIATWCDLSEAEIRAFVAPYTPEWAAKESGVPAADIKRLAIEFGRAAPTCAAFTNRGSDAHYNGMHNSRAVVMLNAIVGSIGKPGGYCYGEEPRVPAFFADVEPRPPRPTRTSVLENPPEYPLANKWQRMRVGQLVYAYLKENRAKIQVYLSYTLASPTTWPEGRSLAVDVLKDESKIAFHACSDVVYSETAHYADMILPDAAYTERWGFDFRNNFALRRYVTLRQPMQKPPGECLSFADSLINIAKRLGPDVAKYYPFDSHEEQMRMRMQKHVFPSGENGWDFMRRTGVWNDMEQQTFHELYNWELTAKQLEGAKLDEATGFYRKAGADGVERVIGIRVDGKARRGFPTPSRKFTLRHPDLIEAGNKVGWPDDGLPRHVPIPAHADMPADRFHLVTFKWNVHTQGRTAPQKLLTEIVHDNPMWINTQTAASLGIKTGDDVEITTYRPKGATYQPTGEKVGSAVVRVVVMEGIHPRVLAVSNSLGHMYGGRAATAKNAPRPSNPGYSSDPKTEDSDLAERVWWDKAVGGKGAGFNINAILPIQPSPLVGMQGWFDTTCTIRKV